MNISRKKFYQNASKPANYVPNVLVGTAPAFPPTMSGLMQIDPSTGDIWISAGNELVSDWRLITGGGGGTSLVLETNGVTNGDQALLNLRDTGGSGISGVILEDGGSGTVFVSLNPSVVKTVNPLTANVTIPLFNQTTFINVPGFAFNVVAGQVYSFKFLINYAVTAPGNGVGFSINGVSNDFLNYYMLSAPTTGAANAFVQNLNLTSYNTAPPSIEGIVSATASGAVSASIISDGQAGNCFIAMGSYVEYIAIPI
jgi:hypothetical protein